ncbi:MAG TPA: GTP cyclohydrolase I, partial [Candidatus Eisenbacteria bacterium]
PFFGRAHVAYLPGARLMGISGAARLLAFYARRPQLQERLTTQIADHLERVVSPRGVAVVLQARHLCMEMRGARARGTVETRVVRGALASPPWAGVLDRRPRS